jgi:type I restriction enzyme S subunit
MMATKNGSSQNGRSLPEGWGLKTVGDLYNVLGGGTPSTAVPEYWSGDIPWITSADIHGLKDIRPRKNINQDAIDNSATTLVPAGSLIVVTRVSLGKVAITNFPLCFSQDSQALIAKNKNVLPGFALYYLAQAVQSFKYQGRGTTISGVTKKQLKELSFPLAPLPEQERIVRRIEELFSDLEAGLASLGRVQMGLQRYKASVLKAACEGRIFGDFELGNEGLPVGWQWTTVGELAAEEPYSITDGPFGSKLKTQHYTESGPRVIRLQNIGDGEFRDARAHISQEHFDTLKKHRIHAGDLVIAGLGESLPRACIIPEYVGDAIVKADCIRFKPNPELAENKYLLYALNSETVKKLSAKIVHGIGRPRMNQQEIKAIPIPLPPLDEQRRIVAEVERRLSVVGEVESAVEVGLVRAGRLRQSVLRSAFEGRL